MKADTSRTSTFKKGFHARVVPVGLGLSAGVYTRLFSDPRENVYTCGLNGNTSNRSPESQNSKTVCI